MHRAIDLAARIGDGLAALQHHRERELLLARADARGHVAADRGALVGAEAPRLREGGGGARDRALHLRGPAQADLVHDGLIEGGADGDDRRGLLPASGDVGGAGGHW
jgi:hypothetical protein